MDTGSHVSTIVKANLLTLSWVITLTSSTSILSLLFSGLCGFRVECMFVFHLRRYVLAKAWSVSRNYRMLVVGNVE